MWVWVCRTLLKVTNGTTPCEYFVAKNTWLSLAKGEGTPYWWVNGEMLDGSGFDKIAAEIIWFDRSDKLLAANVLCRAVLQSGTKLNQLHPIMLNNYRISASFYNLIHIPGLCYIVGWVSVCVHTYVYTQQFIIKLWDGCLPQTSAFHKIAPSSAALERLAAAQYGVRHWFNNDYHKGCHSNESYHFGEHPAIFHSASTQPGEQWVRN